MEGIATLLCLLLVCTLGLGTMWLEIKKEKDKKNGM